LHPSNGSFELFSFAISPRFCLGIDSKESDAESSPERRFEVLSRDVLGSGLWSWRSSTTTRSSCWLSFSRCNLLLSNPERSSLTLNRLSSTLLGGTCLRSSMLEQRGQLVELLGELLDCLAKRTDIDRTGHRHELRLLLSGGRLLLSDLLSSLRRLLHLRHDLFLMLCGGARGLDDLLHARSGLDLSSRRRASRRGCSLRRFVDEATLRERLSIGFLGELIRLRRSFCLKRLSLGNGLDVLLQEIFLLENSLCEMPRHLGEAHTALAWAEGNANLLWPRRRGEARRTKD
jgi:hypothetical protein